MAATKGALHPHSRREAELELTLGIVREALTFVNERTADLWFYPISFSTSSPERGSI